MAQKKVGHVRIDGKVPTEKRHDRVKAFQEDSKIRCAILSIMAASQGLTLTAASTIIFAELAWTPSILNQAEDRAHRIGQKNCVNIYYMNGRGTVDDEIFKLINNKALVTTDVTDGFKTSLNITQTELEELPIDEFANKDGTIQRSIDTIQRKSDGSTGSKANQSMLEKFFQKKSDTFNKRTKDKGKVIAEDIEDSGDDSDAKNCPPQATNWDEEVKHANVHVHDAERRLSSEFKSQQSRDNIVESCSRGSSGDGKAVAGGRQSNDGFKFAKKAKPFVVPNHGGATVADKADGGSESGSLAASLGKQINSSFKL